MKAFPIVPNDILDMVDDVWYKNVGPVIDSLHIQHKDKSGQRGLKTGSVYMPRNGAAPRAAVYIRTIRQGKDLFNKVEGKTVEELMAWCEQAMEIVSHPAE